MAEIKKMKVNSGSPGETLKMFNTIEGPTVPKKRG